jgi:toxin ParE1/3/4
MVAVRIQEAASHRVDEIYRYTRRHWGTEQADRYIIGLFEAFEKIETHGVVSRPVPAEFGVDGYFFRYEKAFRLLAKAVERRHRHRDDPARTDASD